MCGGRSVSTGFVWNGLTDRTDVAQLQYADDVSQSGNKRKTTGRRSHHFLWEVELQQTVCRTTRTSMSVDELSYRISLFCRGSLTGYCRYPVRLSLMSFLICALNYSVHEILTDQDKVFDDLSIISQFYIHTTGLQWQLRKNLYYWLIDWVCFWLIN